MLPDQIHSYHTNGASQSVLWIFLTIGCRNFRPSWGKRAFCGPGVPHRGCAPDGAALVGQQPVQKACGAVHDLRCCAGAVPLRPRPQQDTDAHLSARIINYVQQNYTGSLTLEQMARDLGYNYTYLSAYFNQRLHTGFQDFVNQYRVSHAAMLLRAATSRSLQVAEQCGFGTIRSFNRRIFKVIGHVANRLPQAEPMKKALPGWGGPSVLQAGHRCRYFARVRRRVSGSSGLVRCSFMPES